MHGLETIIALNARPELARRGCSATVNLPRPKAEAPELAPCLLCGEPLPEGVRCDCWDETLVFTRVA